MARAWVYKRGRNTFVVLWRDASAKLISKTSKHRHEADAFCHNKVTELQHGGPGASPIKSTWADTCEAYLQHVREIRGKQPETVRQYQNTLAGFSTGVAHDLLEHTTPMLTQEIYADFSPVYRSAADAIPVEEALKGLGLEL